ncbi:MAG: aminotransferase class V-fold PLP-dependent enzyme, partial [Rhodothalassiaceae bacterium]
GEWAERLIGGWWAGWMTLPRRIGDRIAPLVGAAPGEILAADSTSVNLFKLAAAALEARPERPVVLTEADNFPTDLYILDGLAATPGRRIAVRRLPRDALPEAITEDVACVVLSHVHYRTAAMWDMAAINARARAAGTLTLWDLSHSAGALAVDLDGTGADLAVGCGYKFLNGGPGAPAFLFVARRHQAHLSSPLPGWMGHARPFDFSPDYEPAGDIARFACGTPPVLALTALDAALAAFEGVDMAALAAKAQRLGDLFIRLTEDLPGIRLISPRAGSSRGAQVSLAHPEAADIMERLIAEHRVIGDFRPPDILRFGLAPLYTRFVDIYDAAHTLGALLTDRDS